MKKITSLFLAVLLAGCSLTQGNDYSRNLQKWQGSGVTHYRFSLFIGCFCAFSQRMPLSIEVRDGEVVSMAYSDGQAVLHTDPNFENFSQYATFERLFAELDTDLNGGADEVTVSYDPTYGFPFQIQIDFIKLAMDDELSLTVSDFEVLK